MLRLSQGGFENGNRSSDLLDASACLLGGQRAGEPRLHTPLGKRESLRLAGEIHAVVHKMASTEFRIVP